MRLYNQTDDFPTPITSAAILASVKPSKEETTSLVTTIVNGVKLYLALLATMVAMWYLYWPIARGFCWLVLAIGYACGVDGSSWPGPYTPYPEHF